MVGKTDYASDESLMESIHTMNAVWNISLHKYLEDLGNGVVDSVSFTKDKPYHYFFARRYRNNIAITIKETDKTINFSIPSQDITKILIV